MATLIEANGKTVSRREALIAANEDLITKLQSRLKAKRFVPHDGDSQKQGYIRLLIQALKVHNEILKDVELDQLKQEIQELKESMACKSRE
jgi:hypothetical protein